MMPREMMCQERKRQALAALDALEIAYELIEHQDARTMEALEDIDRRAGARHCKNLFLCNRQQTEFYLLLMGPTKAFCTADMSRQLGVSRLSFASPELLERYLGLSPGAVSPLGLINDSKKAVTLLLDEDVGRMARVLVHPNVSTASVVLRGEDLLRFLETRGNRRVCVTVPSR